MKDRTLYADEGPLGAAFYHTLTTDSGNLDKATWDETRVGMLCMDFGDYGDLKANEEKACSMLYNGCTYEQKAKVHLFFAQINKAHKRAKQARLMFEGM